jgi:hypothetical protein
MLRMPYTIDKLLGMVKSILPETASAATQSLATRYWPAGSAAISFSNIL